MDKILSARVDEGILYKISLLANKLRTSKKKIIENAIEAYSQALEEKENLNIFDQTCGAWKRDGSSEDVVKQARDQFRKSMSRRQL